MHSGLYDGWVRHRRLHPAPHAFRQRLFMVYLDLAEIDEVFRDRWLWGTHRGALVRFRRSDYLGDPAVPLDEAVRERVARETGSRPRGPIRLLAHFAHFGYGFNPVSFYYCFERGGERVQSIVAEITNTPWGERHAYVLQAGEDDSNRMMRRRFAKNFHVSPFMPMALQYDWRFSTPARSLAVHLDVLDQHRKVFDATLVLRRREITGATLARALVQFPAMTLRVIAGIYWQALRLHLKRVPFHAHPDSRLAHNRLPTSSAENQ
jgi:uncharacterized protein